MSAPGTTPGRWVGRPSMWKDADVCIFGADGIAVAHVIDRRNAPIISAAPALYDALEAAKEFLKPDLEEPGRTVFWKLVDALALARGEHGEVG